jgi:hypothetical protein
MCICVSSAKRVSSPPMDTRFVVSCSLTSLPFHRRIARSNLVLEETQEGKTLMPDRKKGREWGLGEYSLPHLYEITTSEKSIPLYPMKQDE